MTTSLLNLARGRDNNLNLIRILAATLVLISHSYVLATGNPAAEPWDAVLGRSPGGMAVEIFFLVSGFLVTASVMKSATLWPYVRARMIRIYPGLWVALVLTIGTVGMAGYTSLASPDFFQAPPTWKYLLKNAVMITGAEGALPGAFAGNPYSSVVNGSLWTLRYELRLYALLALLWWSVHRLPTRFLSRWWVTAVSALAAGLTLIASLSPWLPESSDFVRLGGLFFSGAAAWVWRDRIRIEGRWAAAGLLGMVIAARASPHVFEPVYRIAMPYVLAWLAYRPAGWFRAYNRVGDYSYGVYIYAFPVQQMMMASHPGLSVWDLTASALGITLLLAMISWHAIEHPALTFKSWRSAVA